MNTININFPAPPVDAVMPVAAQDIALWLSAAILAVFVVIAVRMSAKQKTLLPPLFLIAGYCTVVLEPIVCHLGHAFHPQIGQFTLFKTNNVAVPVYIAIIYSFYFGGVYMALFSRIVNDSFTSAYVWKAYLIICAMAYLIEVVPVSVGLWIYYDPQTLWLWKGGAPLFWAFANPACIVVPLALIKFLYPILKGWKQLLVLVLSPMGAVMGHLGVGFPFYSIANSSASANPLLVQLSGLLSLGLALLVVYICIKIMTCTRLASE